MKYARPTVSRSRQRAFRALVERTKVSSTTALAFTAEAPCYVNKAAAQAIEREARKRSRAD